MSKSISDDSLVLKANILGSPDSKQRTLKEGGSVVSFPAQHKQQLEYYPISANHGTDQVCEEFRNDLTTVEDKKEVLHLDVRFPLIHGGNR